ncbi:hypothetical protein PFY12_15295 [Chryseobacterium camelliae]|uniref:YopA central domain-containing protein n=1 Tax=Chryseobacterium camelliae TaxID=1265445 RepID=A0ABY7QL68_9FLAO|nr:hypothetical protein [Chryseobacterium camelliae]WBV60385.1 hypothetical protein PFY12_15295 [Chryseobacterium camelliae]
MSQEKAFAVSPIIETTNRPNEKINIYDGELNFKTSNSSVILAKGHIYFKWFPHLRAEFNAELPNEIFGNSLFEADKIEMLIGNNLIGNCYISSQNIGVNHTVKGGFFDKFIIGDKTLTAKTFKFSILNFDDFLGENIEYVKENSKLYSKARIKLQHEKFEILIDKCEEFKEKFELLKENGGYQILHNGQINILKNSFSFDQITELVNILGHFLSFVSGRKNNPLFLSALHNDEILYQEYTGYPNYPYEFRPSWNNTYSTKYLNSLFTNFYELWKSNTDNKFFLTYIIHWYTEINCNSGYSEGSLIMAQTALELLYNWLIVENKKLIIGKDSENISASNKMRLLLSQLSISYDVPEKFSGLEKFRIDNKCLDAIEAVVQIRNAIVHSQEEKRKRLSEIDEIVIYQAVQLSTWYIEMSLLNILKFEDKYSNRCSKEIIKAYKLELPPWKK